MTAPRDDDDAFTWEGDEPARQPAPPKGVVAVGLGADAVGHDEDDALAMPAQRGALSNAVLVALGVLGGIHALYSVGWAVAALRLGPVSALLVTPAGGTTPPLWGAGAVMTSVLAVAAPLVWFSTTFVLTRGSPSWVRIAGLLAGVALLVPWPFVSVGAVGT